MRVLPNGQLFNQDVGVIDMPDNIIRVGDEWRVCTIEGGSFFKFEDVNYDSQESLVRAITFRDSFGYMDDDVRIAHRKLFYSERLSTVGVPFAYYRSGLNNHYIVTYRGHYHTIPFDNGRGMTKAVKLAQELVAMYDTEEYGTRIGYLSTIVMP